MAYIGAGQNKYTVFPLDNYTFGTKSAKVEKQRNLEARFKHLKEKCDPAIQLVCTLKYPAEHWYATS
jgi:hypothetical protein